MFSNLRCFHNKLRVIIVENKGIANNIGTPVIITNKIAKIPLIQKDKQKSQLANLCTNSFP